MYNADSTSVGVIIRDNFQKAHVVENPSFLWFPGTWSWSEMWWSIQWVYRILWQQIEVIYMFTRNARLFLWTSPWSTDVGLMIYICRVNHRRFHLSYVNCTNIRWTPSRLPHRLLQLTYNSPNRPVSSKGTWCGYVSITKSGDEQWCHRGCENFRTDNNLILEIVIYTRKLRLKSF